jgi:hypothetical protein
MCNNSLSIAAFVSACFLLEQTRVVAEGASTVAAWKRRSEEVRTLEIHWTRKRHLEPGSEAGKNLRSAAPDGSLYPPHALDLETELGFWLSGDRWRLEWKGDEWAYQVERPIKHHEIKVFDGQKSLIYYGRKDADVDTLHDSGSVLPAMANNTLARTPDVTVPLAIYRPFAEPYGHFVRSEWVLASQSPGQRIGGMASEFFQFQHKDSVARHKAVAIAAGDPPLIQRLEITKRLIFELSYDQSRSPPALRGWTMTKLSPTGSIQTQEAITVTSLAENMPVDESMFTLEFPEGTLVTDETLGKGKDHVYIVRGGQERVVSMLERRSGVPYSVLRSSEPDEFRAGKLNRPYGWKLYALGAGGLLAIIALAFCLRRVRSITRATHR